MLPELQPPAFRPYISSSASSPSFLTSSVAHGDQNPNLSPSSSYYYAGTSRASGSGSRRASSSNKNPRLSSSSFGYNARIAIALVPSAAFLLDLGGTPVVATLVIGLMVAYIIDYLSFKFGSFLAVWFTLIVAQITFFFSSSHFYSFNYVSLGFLAYLTCAFTNFLIGVWVSLQFKWLQIEYPTIVVALERLLFACVPVTASAVFTWATVSADGMINAGYYLMVFNCIFYWLYSIPHASSFKAKQDLNYHGSQVPEDSFILGQLESCFHSLNLLFCPLMFHVASHYLVMFHSSADVSDLFLLFFIPFLLQLYASTRGALWWVTKSENSLRSIQFVNGTIALIIVVICLEVRVVFLAFGRYMHVPPPLSYMLVTITMLGSAAAAGAYTVGLVSDAVSSRIFTALAMIASAAGALVVGIHVFFLPVPLAAGYHLACFLTKKNLWSYFSFVVLGILLMAWFVVKNYWDLNIWIAGMPLKSFCKLIVGNVTLALMIPGIAVFPAKFRVLSEAGLIGHALLLCYIENSFFNYSNYYYYGTDEDVMYPTYMVVFTTFVGLAIVHRLSIYQKIGQKVVWVLICLYSAKLSLLFMASKAVLWVTVVLLLAVSPPLLLYKDKSKLVSKMKPWQGCAHASIIALSVLFCRETIFDALQWWNGRPPSDGLVLGSCILITALACIPILALHFPNAMTAKRYLVLAIATGVLFILMQPPVPFSWTYRSVLIKSSHHLADEISIYGFMASKPTWPSWLLIAAILLTLAAVTSIIPIRYIVELRTLYAISVGVALGIYIAAEYFLQAAILHVFIVVTMVCTLVFVVFTHIPSASSTKLLPWVFALIVALFPVTYLLEGQVRINKSFFGDEVNDISEEDSKIATLLAVEGARTSLLGLYAAIFMLIALEIKFELASLMREKISGSGRLRPSQLGQNTSANVPPKLRFMKQRRATTMPAFTIKKIASEGAWMPAVGNVATIMCFAICLILNVNLTGGSNRAIFFLAPILLLLNQDSDFFAGFGDKQRYFPVTIVISGYFILTALYNIWEDVWLGNPSWGVQIGGPDWIFIVKNVALLILTLPGHILFNQFVWSHTKKGDAKPLLTIPLNLPSVIMSDILKIKILGLLGVIYSLSQYMISRQQHLTGLRYI